jgi:hypothetical protein
MRSDRSHSNYNGAQVTGVEKREVKIPMEVQKQAGDLDEKVSGVAAPAVGLWQRQLNELGGVKPLAFGASTRNSGPDLSSSWTSWRSGGCGRSGQEVPHPQPRSSEGSAAPAAAAAGGKVRKTQRKYIGLVFPRKNTEPESVGTAVVMYIKRAARFIC